jgi:UDP-N-acetylglucosamine 2-epimerase (non-hydrolysing)
MRAAPVLRGLASRSGVRQTLVHTGQHYDDVMSDVFFHQLEMPQPDVNLEVGSATHAQQTAEIMRSFEPVVLDRKPEIFLVYGDVNSTVAAALVCSKLGIPVGHVEAGLHSRDRSMPEESNRLVTDQLSDLLFTPSSDADENLLREGIDASRIHCVGKVMIDTLVRLLPQSEGHKRSDLSIPYALVTVHRPSNVDDLPWLRRLLVTLAQLSEEILAVFPVHPRPRQCLDDLGALPEANCRLRLLGPLPYLEFLSLQSHAAVVITDSGGIQEETTFLGIPCVTLRDNAERPITVTQGTNQLVGRDLERLRNAANIILKQKGATGNEEREFRTIGSVPLWDGHAAERIADIIVQRWVYSDRQDRHSRAASGRSTTPSSRTSCTEYFGREAVSHSEEEVAFKASR